MRGVAVDALGEKAAGKIGAAYEDGKIDKAVQLIAHAALGGAMASADGKDAASGAIGGVVGEVAGDLFVQNWLRGKLADPNASNVLTQQEVDALTARGVDLSKLAAGIAAASVGLDVNTAARTGGNAAQHNVLPIIVIALNLTAIGLTIYDVSRVIEALRAGDSKQAGLIAAGIIVGWGGGYLAGKAIRATYDLMVKSGLGTAAFEFLASAAGKAGMSAEQIARLDASTASMERVAARFEAMAGKGAASTGASRFSALAPKAGEAVFWSGQTGGMGGEIIAKQVASKSSGVTLEMLLEQNKITMPAGTAPNAQAAWDEASRIMAQRASGTVRVVLGQDVRPNSTWNRIEWPELIKNINVKEIIAIDPKTGVTKVLIRR